MPMNPAMMLFTKLLLLVVRNPLSPNGSPAGGPQPHARHTPNNAALYLHSGAWLL